MIFRIGIQISDYSRNQVLFRVKYNMNQTSKITATAMDFIGINSGPRRKSIPIITGGNLTKITIDLNNKGDEVQV